MAPCIVGVWMAAPATWNAASRVSLASNGVAHAAEK